jgi:hypothetical protein
MHITLLLLSVCMYSFLQANSSSSESDKSSKHFCAATNVLRAPVSFLTKNIYLCTAQEETEKMAASETETMKMQMEETGTKKPPSSGRQGIGPAHTASHGTYAIYELIDCRMAGPSLLWIHVFFLQNQKEKRVQNSVP